MNFTTSVRIERPVAEVFDYVSDPVNFPVESNFAELKRILEGR
jgi:hypothetical protein